MKITKTQLRRIIKEELSRSLREGTQTKGVGDATTPIAKVKEFQTAADKAMEHARANEWSSVSTYWRDASEVAPDSGGVEFSHGLQEKDVDELLADLNVLGTYFKPVIKIS